MTALGVGHRRALDGGDGRLAGQSVEPGAGEAPAAGAHQDERPAPAQGGQSGPDGGVGADDVDHRVDALEAVGGVGPQVAVQALDRPVDHVVGAQGEGPLPSPGVEVDGDHAGLGGGPEDLHPRTSPGPRPR